MSHLVLLKISSIDFSVQGHSNRAVLIKYSIASRVVLSIFSWVKLLKYLGLKHLALKKGRWAYYATTQLRVKRHEQRPSGLMPCE